MGNSIYLLSGKRNKVAYANIKAAFSKEKTPYEIKKITKKAYASMGQIFMEILCITKIDRKYIGIPDRSIFLHTEHAASLHSKLPRSYKGVSSIGC